MYHGTNFERKLLNHKTLMNMITKNILTRDQIKFSLMNTIETARQQKKLLKDLKSKIEERKQVITDIQSLNVTNRL